MLTDIRKTRSMVQQLRVKDNSKYTDEDFRCVKKLADKISDKTLEKLEQEGVFVFPEVIRDSEDITGEQFILQNSGNCIRTGNIMGFLGLDDERLVIESRFSNGERDYFFLYLLSKVLDFPNIVNLKTDAGGNDRLLNYLLFIFPYYLKVAMRKGPFKKYIRHNYNDANVRGTVDISRHIEMNTPFIGNIAYNQREFSFDNSLMELVRHTIEFIRRKPYGSSVLFRVKDEVELITAVTPGYKFHDRDRILCQNQKSLLRHAYYKEYLALQKLCIAILGHQRHQIGYGTKEIYGILFDGAWLWEEYVNTLIGESFHHPMNRVGKGAQRLFGGNVGLVYPDFISRDSQNRIIADAKYKPLENIGNRDYLQLLAYMFRFDSKTGYYLYPESTDSPDTVLQLNRGSTYEGDVMQRDDIVIIKHGLKIPSDEIDYDEFKRKMETEENAFKSSFTG